MCGDPDPGPAAACLRELHLQELADERRAAREAIESLRLTPVLFEQGARPHPPRALYRAYLEQSDVFVGLYWQRYGWVAPGERVSGLEDEYGLSGDRPKLIYIKTPALDREPQLATLIDRIRRDDRASYGGSATRTSFVRSWPMTSRSCSPSALRRGRQAPNSWDAETSSAASAGDPADWAGGRRRARHRSPRRSGDASGHHHRHGRDRQVAAGPRGRGTSDQPVCRRGRLRRACRHH